MNNIFFLVKNPVFLCIITVFLLSLARLNVSVALLIGSVLAGILSSQGVDSTLATFSTGITAGAEVALNYAFLGVFAAALSRIGFADYISNAVLKFFSKEDHAIKSSAKVALVELFLFTFAIFSQNLIPIHIAFIPIFVPPLLVVFNRANVDRRKIVCIISFGLVTPYIWLPVGFGKIFLQSVVSKNITENGLAINFSNLDYIRTMFLPALGMMIGLAIAVFVTYRKPRKYADADIVVDERRDCTKKISKKNFILGIAAIAAMFVLQIKYSSILLGASAGFLLLLFTGMIKVKESDSVVAEGFKMMAGIGVVMIVANGFAKVLISTDRVGDFVSTLLSMTGGNKYMTVLMLLVFGWLLTIGIGSSFSTIPIISAIYVPICTQLGLSIPATFALIATSGALGDAGSPVSETALGPTLGLNIDGKHDYLRDTIVPQNLHFNLSLLTFGYIAAMVL